VDTDEPNRVANSVRLMQVKHCVITSVDRDDLKDGGSTIWAETINTIRTESPGTTLETLLPDFRGIWENLDRVLATKPEVVSHNLETVRRLTKEVRIQAKYDRSLECLRRINEADLRTKSGIMLGLGETEEDVYEAMADLLEVGVHILTLGQYLQPSRNHHPVVDWITPDQFAKYKSRGLEMGFKYIESGPLVRSSYHAEKHLFEF
jgi:lipoic acid synthetase